MRSSGSSISAARLTRNSTSVSGGNPFKARPLKKKEPPHKTESTPSSAKSLASIRPSFEVMAAHPSCSNEAVPDARSAVHPISVNMRGARASLALCHDHTGLNEFCSPAQRLFAIGGKSEITQRMLEIDMQHVIAEMECALNEILELLTFGKLHDRMRLSTQSIGNLVKRSPEWRSKLESIAHPENELPLPV